MSKPEETLEIQNVVASTELGQELHLEELANDLSASEYNPEHFPGLVIRTQSPKAATLIFRSGKAVCTGASTVENVRRAVTIVFDELRGLGLEVETPPKITIQNIVSSGDLGQQLNLNAIAIGLGLDDIEYEPEQFPGLVYRLTAPDVVVLMFGSGKAVVTGATNVEETKTAIETVQSRLQELDLISV
jgi:transcription initiation factor TFIID TATA-box-binding protein